MTSGKESNMGEQPIFTCKAHVFHIDPKTKRSWVPASSEAVSVSFFYDSTRSLYRIISVEGSKAVINSTITPMMTFTKTSQKFGQWSDVRANTVYGLGFSSEGELGKFIEKFNEVKEATKTTGAKVTNSSSVTPATSANVSPITSRSGMQSNEQDLIDPPNSSMMNNSNISVSNNSNPNANIMSAQNSITSVSSSSPLPGYGTIKGQGTIEDDYGKTVHSRQQSLSSQHSTVMDSPQHQGKGQPQLNQQNSQSSDMQLKYENDKLKFALAQSSANAKKWEIELNTLKTNNARLTSALQESTANVDEWKRQLQLYKEENARVKAKYADLELGKIGEGNSEALRLRVEALENELRTRNDENKVLSMSSKNKDYVSLQKEIADLREMLNVVREQLEIAVKANKIQKQNLEVLNSRLAGYIQDLVSVHREISNTLNTT